MTLNVRIDAIAHATEHKPRIITSLATGLDIDSNLIHELRSEGHYGNAITTVSASLRGKMARKSLERLRTTLPISDMDHIRETLPTRIGDSTLYLRLDKQEMVGGHIKLNDSGSVRIRITAPVYDGRVMASFTRILGLD